MKTRCLRLFTVCLITLVVLTPAFAVYSRIWQYHRHFVSNQINPQPAPIAIVQVERLPSAQHEQTAPLSTATQPPNAALMPVAPVLLGFILPVPLGFCAGLVLSNQYQIWRDALRKQQVAALEKLWQQSIY